MMDARIRGHRYDLPLYAYPLQYLSKRLFDRQKPT
jgi:hypothetical protein